MEASFEMKVDKLMVKGAKRRQKYDNENKDQFEDDEEEEENDLITTYAVVCILIFILMNLIYKSIFNTFFNYVI